jgi:uncharacterized protein YbjT (DUF2867 family)
VTEPTALVAGSTGLVGRELLRQLAAAPAYGRVVALTRRPTGHADGGRLRDVVVDFERLGDAGDALAADHVFCALGTTIRRAGSRPAFRRVDHDYVVALARAARHRDARHFLLVSAVGADPRSRVFYSRVKGDVEAAVRAVGYPSLTIVRPSLLLGDRAEFRLGEVLMKPLGPLMPRRFRPVHARAVAATLIRAALEGREGVTIIESPDIHDRPRPA